MPLWKRPNDLTVNQLRDLNNMVGQMYRMGRLKNKLIEAKGLRDLDAVVKEFVGIITNGEGLESSSVNLSKANERTG